MGFPSNYDPYGEGQTEINQINGTAGANVLQDEMTWDSIKAGAGNDVIMAAREVWSSGGIAFWEADLFDGGAGNDTVSYENTGRVEVHPLINYGLHVGVNVDLAAEIAYRIGGGGMLFQPDELVSIENVMGSQYADTIRGDGGANVLQGLGGNDVIDGRGGNDVILGQNGNDTLSGGDGNDEVNGGNGNDIVNGNDGNDVLKGDDGNDVLMGGAGNDTLDGGSGNDTLNGGSGTDTAMLQSAAGVQVNLGLGITAGGLGNDILVSIENVTTGTGGDTIFGNSANNRIKSSAGNDYVDGGGGNDIIEGESGNDTLKGNSGNDTMLGGTGSDTMEGGSGNDYMEGNDGNDVMDGGAGNDSVLGGAGDDRLRGGAGTDTVNVGSGADIVVWNDGDLGMDTIFMFNLVNDKVNFGSGFLAAGDVEDNLLVFHDGANSYLAANTADAGWDMIGRFMGVDGFALQDAIDNGSLFATQVSGVGGGAAGDIFF